MTRLKVKNKQDTSGQRPPQPYSDLSWLKFWEEKTGLPALVCAKCDCSNWAKHGAHVQKCDDPLDKKTYIVPLCEECNNVNNTGEFYIDCPLCPVS